MYELSNLREYEYSMGMTDEREIQNPIPSTEDFPVAPKTQEDAVSESPVTEEVHVEAPPEGADIEALVEFVFARSLAQLGEVLAADGHVFDPDQVTNRHWDWIRAEPTSQDTLGAKQGLVLSDGLTVLTTTIEAARAAGERLTPPGQPPVLVARVEGEGVPSVDAAAGALEQAADRVGGVLVIRQSKEGFSTPGELNLGLMFDTEQRLCVPLEVLRYPGAAVAIVSGETYRALNDPAEGAALAEEKLGFMSDRTAQEVPEQE